MITKNLTTLLSDWVTDIPNLTITGLAVDTRHVQPGMAFVALQGGQHHGIEFAGAAIKAGAVAILAEPLEHLVLPSLSVPIVVVPQLRERLGDIAKAFYDVPSEHLFMVGVTGTDGKTSTTHFIAEALQILGIKAAVLGTLGSGLPGQLAKATHTTPDAASVHNGLAQLKEQGFQAVAMEVSSHALDQGRVNGVKFDVAVLTNLTRDHLDYHGSVQAYAEAKRKLFQWPTLKHIVVNLDDSFGDDLLEQAEEQGLAVLGYGIGEPDEYPENTIVAFDPVFNHQGIRAQVITPYGEGELYAPVLGQFNLHNLLAALGVLLVKGVSLEDALAAMAQVQVVPGRMERVADQGTGILVVVDYAHTPGALGQVLKAARTHTQKKLICVFGCGGDRDRGKRPLMAHAAATLADQVIVTDDNPRTESPTQVFDDIRAGFATDQQALFEHDRAQAIRQAIQMAQIGDIVLIAGKGHETTQTFNNKVIDFDDRIQATQALKERAL
ncbi:UDP-N-acetylmuramoyl-L-alanyl-D-glutamate--2,6-diaminopimelate ligase [Thiofilum flexile]|uniref:UDP-N-acetylmuramoyl-L-alanyl-D-glutamate--2, 6-diaminopimelate ligase n=1 Tax=Thiofilum flexile TaxID=125627 RepID=UPI00038229A4|nr:UDP-N-acetylmuramoyl-L-alanyl-D-glutamate--2,6-diaminopimelate ligase [Thiofilum flexile]